MLISYEIRVSILLVHLLELHQYRSTTSLAERSRLISYGLCSKVFAL
jgi:hypothetical protein